MPPSPPKCPRCGAAVTGQADELGFLNCGACGARLRRAPAVKLTIQSPTPSSGATPIPAAAAPPPSQTGNRDTEATDSLLARLDRIDASETLPPGLQSNLMLKAAGFAPQTLPQAAKPDPMQGLMSLMESIQKDLASLRENQQQLAAAVARIDAAQRPVAAEGAPTARTEPSLARPVLILDDDPEFGEQARAAFEKAGFAPVVMTAVRGALDAMGRERPALLVVEPLLVGELSGRDFVNHVKAAMEWIEIPILVHTRAEIANHEQARTDFGGDDYVLKAADSAELVARKAARLLG